MIRPSKQIPIQDQKPHRSRWSIAILIVYLLANGAVHAAPIPGQIIVDPGNRAWLFYSDGSPFFLASPGDPEDFLYRGTRNADGTRSGDQAAIIDKLKSTSANGIYMQIIRSNGGDGGSTHNPFNNSDPSQGLDPDILAQWDTWFQEMDDAGIVIYLFFYDDSARIWNSGDSVDDAERDFFTAIVDRFKTYKHLIWVVGEEYGERYSSARVSALAAIIRASDEHDHPIAVHKNDGISFDEFANDPNIDQFAQQYNQTNAVTLHNGVVDAVNRANGRYNVNMSEATQWGSGATARQKAWACALGGGYVMVLGMDIASTPLSDLQDLGRLRNFMESTDFHLMSPDDSRAAGDTDWVLSSPDDKLIAYSRGAPDSIALNSVDAGTYDLRWLDTVSGTEVSQVDVATSGGEVSWAVPSGIGNEVAVYVVKTGDTAPPPPPPTTPNPPKDLSAE